MTPTNSSGPAFPIMGTDNHGLPRCDHEGMTLLDYFAGQALIGLLASDGGDVIKMDAPERARYAYYQAVCMLEQKNEQAKVGNK